jgi:hypothetical protein
MVMAYLSNEKAKRTMHAVRETCPVINKYRLATLKATLQTSNLSLPECLQQKPNKRMMSDSANRYAKYDIPFDICSGMTQKTR